MPKMKRAGQSGKKGGSVIDDELNNPTPKHKNKNAKNQKQKKQSRGK